MENKLRKVIIIGSGPAGYTAAIYLGRAGYEPLVIAGALTPGGQLMNTTEVENYPGFPEGILGPDLMESMQKQAEKFGAEVLLNDVTSVDFKGTVKLVTTDDGITYESDAVIVSTGSQVRKLGVPGELEYSGRGVSYCATCDGFFFRGKPITVVGGGDSAFEEALFLTRFGSSVTLIHRRNEFRASKIMVDRAKENEKIKFITNSVVDEVHGNDVEATSLTVRNVITGETQEVESAGLFVAIGHTPATKFLNNQLNLNEDGTIVVDGATTRTSVEGVFAAGDVVDNMYRQAISA
ncbi:thioredoxin-disulfide reductase, partial [Bifidobacteriaceae bacterium NR015]